MPVKSPTITEEEEAVLEEILTREGSRDLLDSLAAICKRLSEDNTRFNQTGWKKRAQVLEFAADRLSDLGL